MPRIVPPGWHPDNQTPGLLRWWDGTTWTAHTRAVEPPPPRQGTVNVGAQTPLLQPGTGAVPPPPRMPAAPLVPPPPTSPASPSGSGAFGRSVLDSTPFDSSVHPTPALGASHGNHRGRPSWMQRRILIPAVIGLLALVGVIAEVTAPPESEIATEGFVGVSSSTMASLVPSESISSTAAPVGSSTAVSEPDQQQVATTGQPATTSTAAPTTEAPTTEVPTTIESSTTAPPTTTTEPPTTTTAPPTTTTTTTTAPQCDPNYSGCVPIASDVDCAGGSGNGPEYVSGPIQVIGSDIYDLDRDNDGIACE